MSDGTISLMGMLYGHLARGTWSDRRSSNVIDGGSHFYGCYRCADGNWIAIGAIEPQFYARLCEKLGLDQSSLPDQLDQTRWPQMRDTFARIFASRPRDAWVEELNGVDACFTPILSMSEAPFDPHNVARAAFTEIEGVQHPSPAPRFSSTPGAIQGGPTWAGEGGADAAREWGIAL